MEFFIPPQNLFSTESLYPKAMTKGEKKNEFLGDWGKHGNIPIFAIRRLPVGMMQKHDEVAKKVKNQH